MTRKERFLFVLPPALASGLMLTAAFPSPGLSWLAWVALVPLLFALRDLSPRWSFAAGFLTGWTHFLTLGYWLIPTIMVYGGVPLAPALTFYLGLGACLAVYIGLFALLVSWVRGKPGLCLAAVPVIWVGVEYLRSHLFTGLPWELLGYSQYRHLCLIQVADIAGVYGLSFIIVLVNAAVTGLLLWLCKRPWRGVAMTGRTAVLLAVVALMLASGVCWYGWYRVRTVDQVLAGAPGRTIAVVQGNIDQAQKWDAAFQLATVKKHLLLAMETVPRDPDLIVMPETALPFYFFYEEALTDMVCRVVRQTGTFFLAGAPAFERTPADIRYFNSAFLINPGGEVVGRYDKTHLVPFGEYVPFGRYLPFIEKLVAGVGDFTAGTAGQVLFMNGTRLGVQICYEIIFPDICRRMVTNGADMIINITNDAWYGKSSAPYQHFSMTVLRAVENRRSLVRAANTGISGFIDPAGRIRGATGIFVEDAPVYAVPIMTGGTIYNRTGDLFAKSCVILLLFVILQRYVENIRKKRTKKK
ncbi:MAG: apolipoprotein N-acyltransferase [Thermodesulfobacteriota bacterium]